MDIIVAIVIAVALAQFIDGRVAFMLAIVAVVARRLWRRRKVQAVIDSTGLSREELAVVQKDLARGDKPAAEQRIAAVQARKRVALRAAGIDLDTITPLVGHHIAWTDIVGQVFRVRDFDRGGTTIGPSGEVRSGSAAEPYGHLVVESPILNQAVKLPIIHRDDYLLASSVFDEPELADLAANAELLVTYVPKQKLPGGLAGTTHALHYVIVPLGTLQRYYEVSGDAHMAKPAPQKLFGDFVYEGELKVQINSDPQL